MKLPDFEAWAIFAKVAELGSFARAARELDLSKATVSKAVLRLEQRLRTPLLSRSSRKLSLTETGRSVLEGAARILAEAEAMESGVVLGTKLPRGVVRMAAPMSFGIDLLAPALPAFMEQYPDITVDLVLSDAQADLVGEGFDLALRIASLPDSALRARRICDVRRLLVAAPEYFRIHGRLEHPADLQSRDCFIYTNAPSPQQWHFTHEEHGEFNARVAGRLQCNNADAFKGALLAGRGLALQPEFSVWNDIAEGRLEVALADWSAAPIALNIVTPPGKLRPLSVTVLIDFLVARFASPPWARHAE